MENLQLAYCMCRSDCTYIFLFFFVDVILKLSFIFDATLSDDIYMTFGVFRRPLWPFEFGKSYMLLGSVLANDVNLCEL